MNKKQINIEYKNCLVVFIDILGFKEIIRNSERNPNKLKTIYQSLEFLKKRELPEKWNLQLIEIEESAQYKGVENFDIQNRVRTSAFSDSIVISVEVNEENIQSSLSTLVANLSFIGSKLLIDGILLRGGITLGKLIHDDKGVIIGQGLIDAYKLESEIAKFPRIVLSDKLIKKLHYPIEYKKYMYPYHQYFKRYNDGCVGFSQLIYFQVMDARDENKILVFKRNLKNAKKTIINGLDSSFEKPDIYHKYYWLKQEYDDLIIIEFEKPIIDDKEFRIRGDIFHKSFDGILNKTY